MGSRSILSNRVIARGEADVRTAARVKPHLHVTSERKQRQHKVSNNEVMKFYDRLRQFLTFTKDTRGPSDLTRHAG